MKSFVIGIILFLVLIVGGMAVLSFIDVDVEQTAVEKTIDLQEPKA